MALGYKASLQHSEDERKGKEPWQSIQADLKRRRKENLLSDAVGMGTRLCGTHILSQYKQEDCIAESQKKGVETEQERKWINNEHLTVNF